MYKFPLSMLLFKYLLVFKQLIDMRGVPKTWNRIDDLVLKLVQIFGDTSLYA